MSKVTRNMSTQASRDFWKLAEETAEKVQSWPAWKRAGINVATERTPMKVESGGGADHGSDSATK